MLESMGKIISEKRDVIEAELAKELLKLAFKEMTKSKVIFLPRLFCSHSYPPRGGTQPMVPPTSIHRCWDLLPAVFLSTADTRHSHDLHFSISYPFYLTLAMGRIFCNLSCTNLSTNLCTNALCEGTY